MIFGENGNGKSTLVDAIDFVCNGGWGTLADRSVTGEKVNYVSSIGANHGDVEVSLKSGGKIWTATINKKKPCVAPEDCPRAVILRRHQILELVTTNPQKRYEALRSFFTIEHIEAAEKSLKSAVKEVKEEYDEATRAYEQAEKKLRDAWTEEGN